MYPTVSGSNRRLPGITTLSSDAVVVLPQPKAPFSQMITRSCYEHTYSHAAGWASALRGAAWTRFARSVALGIDCVMLSPSARSSGRYAPMSRASGSRGHGGRLCRIA